MAGMFYSLQETAEKLGVTEDDIKELVRQGRLREFRDGTNLLFKVDEVQSLLSDSAIMASKKPAAGADIELGEDELTLAGESGGELSLEEEFTNADTTVADEVRVFDEADTGSDAGSIKADDDIGLLDDVEAEADISTPVEPVNVLGEADSGYALSDDTKGETTAEIGTGEASLEEIEGDVSLDSFGTGSGLLDLSLQADDTSLGGILDEIYTPGEEAQKAPGGAPVLETHVDAEQMLTAVGIDVHAAEPATVLMSYAEPEPDTASNVFGAMLFIPLLAIIYTVLAALAGTKGIMLSAIKPIQGFVWYIMGGLAGVALVMMVIPVMARPGGPKAEKKPKVKKEKPPKPPKEPKKPKVKKEKKK